VPGQKAKQRKQVGLLGGRWQAACLAGDQADRAEPAGEGVHQCRVADAAAAGHDLAGGMRAACAGHRAGGEFGECGHQVGVGDGGKAFEAGRDIVCVEQFAPGAFGRGSGVIWLAQQALEQICVHLARTRQAAIPVIRHRAAGDAGGLDVEQATSRAGVVGQHRVARFAHHGDVGDAAEVECHPWSARAGQP